MDKITRTDKEITMLYNAVEEDLANLPDNSIFGDSNLEDKEDMRNTMSQLNQAKKQKILPEDIQCELYAWLTGKSNTLWSDYGL